MTQKARLALSAYLPVLVIASLVLGLTIGAVLRGMTPSGRITALIEQSDVLINYSTEP